MHIMATCMHIMCMCMHMSHAHVHVHVHVLWLAPPTVPLQVGGVPELVRDCVEACALDTRREIFGAVLP